MQIILNILAIGYILFFLLGVLISKRIKMSDGFIKGAFVLFSFSIALIVFYIEPLSNWDLTRHLKLMDQIRRSEISFFEFIFNNKYNIGGKEYIAYYSFNILRYILAKISDNSHILPFVCVLIDYCIVSYIMVDWSKENNRNGKVNIGVLLLCFAFLPLVHAVSGMRTALAATIISLGIYMYLYKAKTIWILVILALIAATIHPVSLVTLPFVFFARFEMRLKGIVCVVVLSLLLEKIVSWFSESSIFYFMRMAQLYNKYTSSNQYRGGNRYLYITLFVISLFLVLYIVKHFLKKKEILRKKSNAIYFFLIYYMCYILGNIGNYDMVLRPAYVLGVFAPVLATMLNDILPNSSRKCERLTSLCIRVIVCICCLINIQGYTEELGWFDYANNPISVRVTEEKDVIETLKISIENKFEISE